MSPVPADDAELNGEPDDDDDDSDGEAFDIFVDGADYYFALPRLSLIHI